MNDTKGKEYISIPLELIKANISSMQIRNTHAASILFAIVAGFFVEMSNPAKKDWDMPIYKYRINVYHIAELIFISNITKSR